MKILVHHDGALGDVLLSLPCLRKLREGTGTVHFAGRSDIGRMLRETGIVDESSDSGCSRYGGLSAGGASGELAAFLAQFERAVVFTVAADGPVCAALRQVIRDTRTIVTVPPAGAGTSAALFRLAQFDPKAALEARPLPLPASQRELAAAMLGRWGWKGDRPLVMVHPGSGGTNKRWPLDRFFSLIRTLVAEGTFIVIFTGPAEDDLFLDRVEEFCRSQEGTAHAGDADLSALAALLGHCGTYVGNDSGVSHLAAATGAPTIVLFGPTDPVLWSPVGRQVKVIAAASLDAITVEQVAEAARTFLSGTAGFEHGGQDKW